jgi:cytochrome c oxidase subunit 4
LDLPVSVAVLDSLKTAFFEAGARMNPTAGTDQDDSHDTEMAGVHVVPLKVLLTVWAVLLVLTLLTVAGTHVDLGSGNLWLAMIIATVKATLVALYFMHLRYDYPFHAVVLITALLFLLLFVGLVLVDTTSYQQALLPEQPPPGALP